MFVYAGAVPAAQMRARRCGVRRGGGLWRKPVAGNFKKDTPQNRQTFRECLGRLAHFFLLRAIAVAWGVFFYTRLLWCKTPLHFIKKRLFVFFGFCQVLCEVSSVEVSLRPPWSQVDVRLKSAIEASLKSTRGQLEVWGRPQGDVSFRSASALRHSEVSFRPPWSHLESGWSRLEVSLKPLWCLVEVTLRWTLRSPWCQLDVSSSSAWGQVTVTFWNHFDVTYFDITLATPGGELEGTNFDEGTFGSACGQFLKAPQVRSASAHFEIELRSPCEATLQSPCEVSLMSVSGLRSPWSRLLRSAWLEVTLRGRSAIEVTLRSHWSQLEITLTFPWSHWGHLSGQLVSVERNLCCNGKEEGCTLSPRRQTSCVLMQWGVSCSLLHVASSIISYCFCHGPRLQSCLPRLVDLAVGGRVLLRISWEFIAALPNVRDNLLGFFLWRQSSFSQHDPWTHVWWVWWWGSSRSVVHCSW